MTPRAAQGGLGCSGENFGRVCRALGEFWEVLYIKKLPINRPCGRYVIYFYSPNKASAAEGFLLALYRIASVLGDSARGSGSLGQGT